MTNTLVYCIIIVITTLHITWWQWQAH